jgi:GntR family transcriptional regulator
VGPGARWHRLSAGPLLERTAATAPVSRLRAERWIDAVLADATTHALLQMGDPEPLLQIESIAYGSNGRPLEHYRALHRCRSSRLHVQTTT